MSQHIDVLIFVLVVGLSFVNWIVGQIKEKREIEKINRKRAEQREGAGQQSSSGGASPAKSGASGGAAGEGSLAERRRERLRELREKQAERTREQVEVMTGQRHAGAGTSGRGAPTRAQPVPARGPRGGAGTASGSGSPSAPGSRRPVRPGRTARKTGPGDVSATEISSDQRSGERESAPRTLEDTGAAPLSKAFTPLSERSPDVKPLVRAKSVDWRRAIVLSEILAPPVSMRPVD